MINFGFARRLCVALATLIAAPPGMAQTPVPPTPAGPPLRIVVLEGGNAINSIPLMRSVPPVIEVHDGNDFPVEGAAVTFTLPDIGPGGTFAGGATKFSTRTDSHGQAGAPLILPRTAGKFQIKVGVSYGVQKGEELVTQTNSPAAVFGAPQPVKRWYTKKRNLILIGSAVVAGIVVIVLTTGGSSSTSGITVTPGAPVFH